MNFNLSSESGSHWVCYYKQHTERIYFDSYEQVIFYIKSDKEKYKAVIQRNTNDIQTKQNICGHLCIERIEGKDGLTISGAGIKSNLANELHKC